VVSEPIDAAHDQWTAVAPNTVLTVEAGGRVRLASFEVDLDRRVAVRVA
jgi:glutamine amidotransferase